MQSSWTLEELCCALGCRPLQATDSFAITGFSIDSRTLKAGEFFICLKGEKNDGHDYIKEAQAAGAGALLIEESYLKSEIKLPSNITIFSKKNTLKALQELAAFHRQRLEGVIIAITGSNGKTSSKEMLAGLLGTLLGKEVIYATSGNLNNHIGLPLSLLRAKAQDSYVILEMGMNHAGEICFLSKLAKPHHAIITSIANAHREFFKDTEAIAQAKLEILEGMPDPLQSHLVYHALSPGTDLARKTAQAKGIQAHFFALCSSICNGAYEEGYGPKIENILEKSGYGDKLQTTWEGIKFFWEGQEIHCKNFFNPASASNLLACLCLLSHLGFQPKELSEAAQDLGLESKQRFERICKERSGRKAQLLIDDSYNANPESFIAAIDALRQLLPNASLALCMGEMAELGEEAEEGHRKVADRAARAGYDLLALVEGNFSEIIRQSYLNGQQDGKLVQAPSSLELAKLLESSVELANFDGILIKGSRAARMDLLSEHIQKNHYL